MSEIDFVYASTPIDAAELDRIERQFGFTFPTELRDIYLKFNGGQPVRKQFVMDDDTYTVNMFMPIKQSRRRGVITMERCIQWTKIDNPLVPEHLVPFAVDSFGGFFCFSVRHNEFGAVYMFRAVEPDLSARWLAPSVAEFLARLSA